MHLQKIQNNTKKLPELVMSALIDAIESGQIQVGQELPSERDLAEKLGVGRGSLRECMAILEFLGAVESCGYRKAVARDADYIRKALSFIQISVQANTQDDFNEFRKINEMAIAALACERATKKDLAALEETLVRMERAPEDYTADVDFHDALAVASHNTMLAGTIHLVNSMIADLRNRYVELPGFVQTALESHKAIFEAVKAKDAEAARREMKHHLEIVDEFRAKYSTSDGNCR